MICPGMKVLLLLFHFLPVNLLGAQKLCHAGIRHMHVSFRKQPYLLRVMLCFPTYLISS